MGPSPNATESLFAGSHWSYQDQANLVEALPVRKRDKAKTCRAFSDSVPSEKALAHNLPATTSKRRDAPDLRLTGIAAAAPATELAAFFDANISTVDGKIPAAMTLWSWSQFSARGSTMSAMRT